VGAIGDAGGGVDELGWVAGGVADAVELCPSTSKLFRAPPSSVRAAGRGVDELGYVTGGVANAAKLCLSSSELLQPSLSTVRAPPSYVRAPPRFGDGEHGTTGDAPYALLVPPSSQYSMVKSLAAEAELPASEVD
jgi:hypothetical protein